MDTLNTRSSPEEDDMGHTADPKESSARFAMRIDGKIDRSHVYPLTAQEILDMLRISRSSCDLYTCHEVHMRILQALVPDESEPDPDAVQYWLDHQIVFGEPTLSLAEQMGEHLSRGVCARLQAEQWLEEEQEAQWWLEQEAQQTALSYEAWLARVLSCAWRRACCSVCLQCSILPHGVGSPSW